MSGSLRVFDRIISFNVIQQAYDIDLNSETRIMPDITINHVYPSRADQNSCKLAVQIFSKPVAEALRAYAADGQIDETLAHDTAFFIDNMSNLLDSLNSFRLFDKNPLNSGLCEQNELVFLTLKTGIEIFNSLTKLVIKKSVEPEIGNVSQDQQTDSYNVSETRPKCFDNMVCKINAVLGLFEEGKEDKNRFLLTSRLSRAFLEQYISIIKDHCGGENNLSTKLFRLEFQKLVMTSLFGPCSSKISNVEKDNPEYVILNGIQTENDILTQEKGMEVKSFEYN